MFFIYTSKMWNGEKTAAKDCPTGLSKPWQVTQYAIGTPKDGEALSPKGNKGNWGMLWEEESLPGKSTGVITQHQTDSCGNIHTNNTVQSEKSVFKNTHAHIYACNN